MAIQNKHPNCLVFLTCLFSSIWNTTVFFVQTFPLEQHTVFLSRLAFGSGATFCVAMTFFVFVFPNYKLKKYPKLLSLILCMYLFVLYHTYLLTFLNLPITESGYGPLRDSKPTSFFIFFILYVFFCMTVSSVLLFKRIRSAENITSKKVFWMLLIGINLFYIPVYVFAMIIPMIKDFNIHPFTKSSYIFFITTSYYCITKYQLFSIRTVVHQRLLWAVFSFISFFVIAVSSIFFNQILNLSSVFTIFIQIMALFLLLLFYRYMVQPFLDHLFFRRRFQLKTTLREIQENIINIQKIDELANTVLRQISNTLYPKDCTIYFTQQQHGILVYKFSTKSKSLEKHYHLEGPNTHLHRFPIESPNYVIGEICVNEKKNLKAYSADELFFLNKLGKILGKYFENALLYESLIHQKDTLKSKQNELIKQKIYINNGQTKEDIIRKLTYFISHEVKNILYAISGSINTIKRYPELIDDPKKKKPSF